MKWTSFGRGLLAAAVCGLLSLNVWAKPHAAGAGGSQAYEAQLPAGLETATDMCALLPCKDVFPGATSFSERKGQPPYVEALGGPKGKDVLGYVMLSTDITDTPAYSGKPVVTLIGMDKEGKFVGVKVLKHSEPILLLGIPESALLKFNDQYLGRSVKDTIEVGQSRPEDGVIGVDAISGATVTVVAQNQVIMTSGAAVARQVGIIKPIVRKPVEYVQPKPDAPLPDWDTLVKQGAVQKLVVQPQQVGLDRTGSPFIELWFGSLNSPIIGPAILGKSTWEYLHSELKEGENAIFIIRTDGKESFKGSGFVRGGIYDRIQVHQEGDSFTFRDTDVRNLYSLAAKGAPQYSESGIFIIRSRAFSAAYPWKLSFLSNKIDRNTGSKVFTSFESEYWTPGPVHGRRPPRSAPARPQLAQDLESQVVAADHLRPDAHHHRRGLRLPRDAHPHVVAQEQVAGQWLQVPVLGHLRGLGGLWPAGTAVGHAGTDLVPLHPLQVGVDTVPQRSVPVPLLDLHLHHRVRVRPGPVLRLGLPVRLAAGGAARHR